MGDSGAPDARLLHRNFPLFESDSSPECGPLPKNQDIDYFAHTNQI